MKIVKLSAEWCGPCQVLHPIFEKVSKLEKFNGIKFEEIDVETDEGEEYVEKFSIRNVPTILILNENNELVSKKVGSLLESQLIQFINDSI